MTYVFRDAKTNIVISVQQAVSDIEVSVEKCLHQRDDIDRDHHKVAIEVAVVVDIEIVHAADPVAAVVEEAVMTTGVHFTTNQLTRNMELHQRQSIQSKSKIFLLAAVGKT